MSRSHLYITGTINYSPRKITLTSGDISYFVKPYSAQSGYVHGDRVRARITKRGDGGYMPEVEILSLVCRSHVPLLARIISKKGKQYLRTLPELGNLEIPYFIKDKKYDENCILSVQFDQQDRIHILSVFGQEDDTDIDERLILWFSQARTFFDEAVVKESEYIKSINTPILQSSNNSGRTNFCNWYTLTMDGSDAKDLDDAISIRQELNGDFLLAVHIADVAEYVTEGSLLDREALKRATSIYTPGKVIPMLPEILSNDLCSLHPGSPKLTLSCIMTIDPKGNVRHTDIVEGIIQSQHQGIYDRIMSDWIQIKNKGIGNIHKTVNTDSISDTTLSAEYTTTLQTAFLLYQILEKRRRKEGKITFESTEIYFEFGNSDIPKNIPKKPLQIKKRERNDAHKLIEEFMVLANEEVAKWCHQHDLPFLSRVHGLPGNEQTEIIQGILKNSTKTPILENMHRGEKLSIKDQKKIILEPTHIREFLEKIEDPVELYRYSRLLLPKMAKATYSDSPFRHFGLALEYYSHFTSPIRRYPDLQIHRIIKEKIRNTLTLERSKHYKSILKKVARSCSEQERNAENIERSMNSLYTCRYMTDKVGKVYSGQISGLSEFAIFVELENGIETTLYIPRDHYRIDSIAGTIRNESGNVIATIGEFIEVKVESINMSEKRVIVGKL